MRGLPFPKYQKPKKTKAKRKKLRSISSLKKKAWGVFSEYIRRSAADSNGNVICVCCKRVSHWKLLHASHLVPGRRLGILFDERGVFPSCYQCNVCDHGNLREFDVYMVDRFGKKYTDDLIAELRRNSKQPTKWTRDEYEAIYTRYKGLLEGLDAA